MYLIRFFLLAIGIGISVLGSGCASVGPSGKHSRGTDVPQYFLWSETPMQKPNGSKFLGNPVPNGNGIPTGVPIRQTVPQNSAENGKRARIGELLRSIRKGDAK